MKLFLASSFDKTAKLFEKKLAQSLSGKKVVFIANAADNHTSDPWWVKSDRDVLLSLGCEIIETDLRTISKNDFMERLNNSDIIHVCGGSVLYLMSLLQEKEFDTLISNAVRSDSIIYSSTSAGSIIAANYVGLYAIDPDEEMYKEKMRDYRGLGLTNFIIVPHADNKKFAEANIKIVGTLADHSQPVLFIYDNQAVWVNDSTFEIVS